MLTFDFDLGLALTIALGGLGVVFIILILLSFAIGAIRRVSDLLDRREEQQK